MEAVIFDIRIVAHFRRPDTVVTHHSYPFITGLRCSGVSAILGEEDLEGERWFGLRLMNRVSSSFQQCRCLGKVGWEVGQRLTTGCNRVSR